MSATSLHGANPQQETEPSTPGCIDHVLAVFERHHHPFILVGTIAGRWNSCNGMAGKEIDLLMKASLIQTIVNDLVETGCWVVTLNPYIHDLPYGVVAGGSYTNTTTIPTVWLRYAKPGYLHPLGLEYLRLWPEELYHLSIDCRKLEVPDVMPTQRITFEEEYYRDPHERFGPRRLSVLEAHGEMYLMPPRSRFRKASNVSMFVPCIEDHVNALLDQYREEGKTGTECGNMPQWHILNFIRYHVWDWPPAATWLLENKIHDRNYEIMKYLLENYARKLLCMYDPGLGEMRFNILPWELIPRPPNPT